MDLAHFNLNPLITCARCLEGCAEGAGARSARSESEPWKGPAAAQRAQRPKSKHTLISAKLNPVYYVETKTTRANTQGILKG